MATAVMADSSAMKSTDPLPEPFASLVMTIQQNSDGTGASGENRAAVAELQARLALAQDRTATRVTWATWALVMATVALIAATIAAAIIANR